VTAIRTIGLTKLYGPIRALDGLDLDVREGEVFGFLGPNGAGKSTAIRLLLGYLHPSAGSGEVLGWDIVTASARLRRQIGYLPGGIAFYDTLTGFEHLDFLARLNRRAPVRRADLCDRLELADKTLRRMVRDYSRGMRQKLGIVQALQHDPELAVLDEPSEGLDPLMQRAFYGILEQLKHDGRTVFFSNGSAIEWRLSETAASPWSRRSPRFARADRAMSRCSSTVRRHGCTTCLASRRWRRAAAV
jgi:beta-exotoxin I transport system ATP-binding protein